MSGHEYAMNLFIVQEARKHGYDPLVLCFRGYIPDPTDEMETISIFKHSPYDKQEVSWQRDQRLISDGNKEIFSVLSKYLPSSALPQHSVILLHTACNTMLVGLARWIKNINRPDLKIRIVLRWPATRRVYHQVNAEKFCKKACSLYPNLPGDIRFYADNKGLVQYYEKLTGLSFRQTPIGIQFHDIPEIPPPTIETDRLRFVFAGSPRKEKGIVQIVASLKAHIRSYPDDIFYIHTIKTDNLAKKLNNDYPNHVITNNHFLSGRPYFDFLLKADVVLIPYDIHAYKLRTSHIFMEALGLGRAVIVTKNSWMEEVLNEFDYPLGVVMNSWSEYGLLKAMDTLHQKRDEILSNAYNTAEKIRNSHNPEQWMNLMLAP
jgi:glycosyltransferase involved in cell wall biosynthesis